ncbi:Fc.00g032810.m01.CDS01 [Cosmosporella sp. VM-42]
MAPPTTASTRGLPIIPIVLLGLTAVFAYDALHLQIVRGGYLSSVEPLLEDGPRFFPGSETLILKRYTGVAAIDQIFTMMNVFFRHATDGSAPAFSIFAFNMAGQIVSFFMVILVESQRVAKGSAFLNPILWGLACQLNGFGLVGPIFFIVHLIITSRSTTADAVRLRDPASLYSVIPGFCFGFVLLTGLMAYPFSNTNVQQWCNAMWQIWPVFVVVIQTLFTWVAKRTSIGQKATVSKTQLDREALDHAYTFAWNVAITTQLATLALLILGPRTIPDPLPSYISENFATSLEISRVFFPLSPHDTRPAPSGATAMHSFFLWDLYSGSIAAFIWVIYLLSNVKPIWSSSGEEKAELGRGIITSLLFAGPGGALVALLQHRDEMVLAREAKAEKSK